jgi:hypothetical protein
MSTTLQLIRDAQQQKKIEVIFDWPLGKDESGNDKSVPVKISGLDMTDILREQTYVREREYALACAEGFEDVPVNEKEWRQRLERITDAKSRENMEKSKPVNRAEQIAENMSMLVSMQKIIPRFLKTMEDQPLFPSRQDLAEVEAWVKTDMELSNLLLSQYTKLWDLYQAKKDAIKNSSAEPNATK